MPARAAARDADEHLDLVTSLPFFAIHLAALAGAFLVGFRWRYLGVAAASYYLRMLLVTAGYHRYFSHRTFKTSRVAQFLLAFFAETSAQKGVLWWAAHHRDHHRYSDLPGDVHSAKRSGLWWSHVGWILSRKYERTRFERIKDFARYPEIAWINKWHLVPPVLLAFACFGLGGWAGVVWGFFIPTVLLWHGTFTINSLAHLFGSVRYESNDDSRNNWLLALITCGEGWHNNHHYYQSSANQGFFWWELDTTYYALKVASWVGLVRDLRAPPRHIRDGKKRSAGEQVNVVERPVVPQVLDLGVGG